MLTSLADVLNAARGAGCAAGGFSCYDLATGAGVVAAAEAREAPIVLILSEGAFAQATGPALVAGLRALAERATVPVALQLDHVSDLDTIAAALDAGVNAVMADGSRLPYADNVAFVQAAVALAVARGAQVEAELGHIAGDEETASATAAGGMTDPAQVPGFLAETGAHCLAVAIGNVHGAYREPPRLDWDRLAAIRDVAERPLSLHGASGLPAADLRRAVEGGVAKVNVNTELRERWLALAEESVPEHRDGARLLAFQTRLADAMRDVAERKLALLDGS
ncbi:MAG TPA: class II fructose-bisphosphate aldolase [Conexibacter sp.]|nr:class II fructose-bisphosphate aldolase [Conexibacter sp.]